MFIMKLREQDSPNLWKMGHNVLWCDNCNSSSTVCDRKTNTCIKCQCWEEKSIYSKWYCIPLQYLSCPSGLEFVSFISWLLYMGKYQNLIQWKIRCVSYFNNDFPFGIKCNYIYSRKWRLHRIHDSKSQKHLEESLPGVSILKPLCTSDDPYLFSNLETFFKLSYPGKVS